MKNQKESQAMSLHLGKNPTTEMLKIYFTKIHELHLSGEGFPANLDEVWALAYGRKIESVRFLKKEFIEGIDYQVLRQKAENPLGGRPVEKYHLTVSCLEYFIARKVRAVFEVYRKVFHIAMNLSIMDVKPMFSKDKPFYDCVNLLGNIGYSTTRTAIYSRRRKNPQEFIYESGWKMSREYSLLICKNAEIRSTYNRLRERKALYLANENQLSLFPEGGAL